MTAWTSAEDVEALWQFADDVRRSFATPGCENEPTRVADLRRLAAVVRETADLRAGMVGARDKLDVEVRRAADATSAAVDAELSALLSALRSRQDATTDPCLVPTLRGLELGLRSARQIVREALAAPGDHDRVERGVGGAHG